MQKKFLTNLGLILFLNLLVKPFWILGIDRSVQNVVGAEDFGFYFAILNYSYLFYILLDLGITNFNNRNIARHSQLLNKHISSILILKFLLGILYFSMIFIVGIIIGYGNKHLGMLGWIGLNQFLLSFILYLRSNISGLLLFKTDSMLSVLDRLLMIVICSVLLWGNVTKVTFRIEWFVYAQTGAYALTALIAFIVVVRKSSLKKLNWNLPFFLVILKKSLPFALLIMLMAFYFRIDSVVIERMLKGSFGDEQSGIYAQAYRLLDAANMIAFLFSVLLLPLFSKMIKEKTPVEHIVKLAFSILFTISVTVAVGSYFYSTELMYLLYPQHISETIEVFNARIEQSAYIFSMLMFGFIAISATYIFGTLLTANGSLKALNIVAGIGMIISLTINLILVPKLYATGSAYASLFSQFLTSIAQVIIAVVIFKFRTNLRYLGILVLFVVSVIFFAYFSTRLPIHWIYSLTLLVTSSFLAAFIFGLLSIKNLIFILKSRE
ncbi:MAG: oligosaccharide flippase family protein [Bacteroidales bacterium]|nr:oligosaccharide flippase family protein [Bacteroidales bacterium]